MTGVEFQEVLAWRMCTDPWPSQSVSIDKIDAWLDRESRERGYRDWIHAYHDFKGETITPSGQVERLQRWIDLKDHALHSMLAATDPNVSGDSSKKYLYVLARPRAQAALENREP